MEAVILAGGKGTRLRPYTTTIPKPLMPVGEKAILEILIKQLCSVGVKKITLAVNHGADLISAFVGNGERFGIQIEYSREEKPLGTVGPIKLISKLPDNFLVMNGDVLTDLNFKDILLYHIRSNALLTVSTYNRTQKIDFGVLEVNVQNNQVIGFQEKPVYDFKVSMGVYVFNRSLLDRVPINVPYGFDDLVLDMLKEKQPINTYPYEGYWMDIGRPDDYDKANQDVERLPFLKE
jgi:NDP-sugar pyrophosphorylase family protein